MAETPHVNVCWIAYVQESFSVAVFLVIGQPTMHQFGWALAFEYEASEAKGRPASCLGRVHGSVAHVWGTCASGWRPACCHVERQLRSSIEDVGLCKRVAPLAPVTIRR